MPNAVLRPSAGDQPRRRVLIVDDSAVARAVMTRSIEQSGRFVASAEASDANAALTALRSEAFDAILLDIELPGVDGLSALPDLLAASGNAPVLVVSGSCAEGAAATLQALALGAADTLVKPAAGAPITRFGDQLVDKLDRLTTPVHAVVPVVASPRPIAGDAFDVVAIGASTGGIHALSQVLRALSPAYTTPILITQHLPASFMPYFAAQVATLAGRPCEVATDHMRIRPGRVIVAPGDAHLKVVALADGGAAVRLTHEPTSSGCLPSVDPMLASVAAVYGPRALGIVLSGMGRDGAEGAKAVAAASGFVVAQDQATSVVWGMPGAVVASGHAHAVLPPDAIGQLVACRQRPA